ncbi:MAG TPA: TetR/AcrR family transcriptional regulator, partial [Propionibacteriaceae bacterium]|nr:TetR/AcrR family transcriptional regulator [Propionibacteriaceae bacterium]
MASVRPKILRKAGRPTGSLRGERKEEIVAVALDVFAESGFHGCSLARVADAVGVSQATVLHHVGSKDGLLTEVLHLRDRLDAAQLDASPDPFGWAGFEYMIDLLEANKARPNLVSLYVKVASEALTPGHPAAEWLHSRFDESIGLLMFSLQMGINDG